LAEAKALKKTPAEVVLVDRINHHVFQPLLCQVATSVLTPSQIATPIRSIFRNQKNTTVIMGEVTGVDKDQKCVFVSDADRQNVAISTVPSRRPSRRNSAFQVCVTRISYLGEASSPALRNLSQLNDPSFTYDNAPIALKLLPASFCEAANLFNTYRSYP
jgi:hypothetical protein